MNKTTINLVYNSRTTRLPAVPQDFDDLCLMIHTIYNNQLQGTFELAYKDNDDNVFVIENDESLNAALNYIE